MGRRTGPSLPDHQPVVSTLARAAGLMGCTEAELAGAIKRAGLQAWGTHAQGWSVWRWRDLVAAAVQAGLPVPSFQVRRWRQAITSGRRKVGLGGQGHPGPGREHET